MPKNETNIDLQCSLCPKNPKFSDVSHLLTHISSKGHLAQRFQLDFRSKSEREAKDKLDAFESWYRRSNLDTLLSNRLAAKDQKKASKDKKSRASCAGVSLLIRVSIIQHSLTSNGVPGKEGKDCPEKYNRSTPRCNSCLPCSRSSNASLANYNCHCFYSSRWK
jgi:hypothetical protein